MSFNLGNIYKYSALLNLYLEVYMLRQFRIKSKQNLITMQVYSWKITCSVIFKLTPLFLLYSVPCLILHIKKYSVLESLDPKLLLYWHCFFCCET